MSNNTSAALSVDSQLGVTISIRQLDRNHIEVIAKLQIPNSDPIAECVVLHSWLELSTIVSRILSVAYSFQMHLYSDQTGSPTNAEWPRDKNEEKIKTEMEKDLEKALKRKDN